MNRRYVFALIFLFVYGASNAQSDSIKKCFDQFFTFRAVGIKENMTDEDIIRYTNSTDSLLSSCLFECHLPEISLKSLNGDIITNAFLKGKVVIMNFWSIECAPEYGEVLAYKRLAAEYYGNENVVLLSVSPQSWKVISTAFPDFEAEMVGWKLITEERRLSNLLSKSCNTTIVLDKYGMLSNYWTKIPSNEDLTLHIDLKLKALSNK